ncbi:MAG: hypothetical protein V4539_09260 [Bacteroidota bacterium]
MKHIHIYALSLLFVFHTSCGQNQTNKPKDNIKSETKDVVTSSGSNEKYHTKYEYTDSIGKRLIILNSFRRGAPYTDPKGISHGKVIFWTLLVNETDNPLELKIDFPVDSFEVPGLPGKYYKLFVPPDTMTIDKEPLYDYSMTGLKSFLDNNIDKPSSLKRTINPKESSGFYVVILFDHEVGGPFQTGLSIKGQNLVYKISRASMARHPLISEKEIHFGSINLKNLMLRNLMVRKL